MYKIPLLQIENHDQLNSIEILGSLGCSVNT